MTNTYRFLVPYNNEVLSYTEEELMNEAHDLREFINVDFQNVDNFYISEVKTVQEAIKVLELIKLTFLDK